MFFSNKAKLFFYAVCAFALWLGGMRSVYAQDLHSTAAIVESILKKMDSEYLYPFDWETCYAFLSKEVARGDTAPGRAQEKDERDIAPPCFDDHSGYLSPAAAAQFFNELKTGTFGGVGLELTEEGGAVVVRAPIAGTPAAKAGFMSGDVILSIREDGEAEPKKVTNVREAVLRLRGKAGTTVELVIRRGNELVTVSLVREIITISSVEYKRFNTDSGDIGYIALRAFNAMSAEELENALRSFNDTRRIIIDVRDNPGGLIESAFEMLYYFSSNLDDILLTQKYKQGTLITTISSLENMFFNPSSYEMKAPGYFEDYTIAILINKRSASASEIFAGALKDWGLKHGRFFVVGETSHGKGVGQGVYELENGGAVKLTIMEFFVGNTKTAVHGRGVSPTYAVSDTRESSKDTATPRDAQFQRALELLQTK